MLVRCQVENARGEHSVRFIEEPHFRLWQYLVVNKHGLVVCDLVPCLWLPAGEYERRASVFGHARAIEPVDRLAFAVYDPATHLASTVQRFVPSAETERQRAHLVSLVPDAQRDPSMLHVEEERGYAIVPSGSVDPSRIGFHFS